jgi:hypothetical protein
LRGLAAVRGFAARFVAFVAAFVTFRGVVLRETALRADRAGLFFLGAAFLRPEALRAVFRAEPFRPAAARPRARAEPFRVLAAFRFAIANPFPENGPFTLTVPGK